MELQFNRDQNQSHLPESSIQERRVGILNRLSFGELITNAKVLVQAKEISLARNLVIRALQLNSKHPLALRLALQSLALGDLNAQKIIYKTLTEVDPQFSDFVELSELLVSQGLDEDAKTYLFEGMSLLLDADPLLGRAYRSLGNIFCRQGDWEAAEEYYMKALTFPNQGDLIKTNLGLLEIQRGNLDRADSFFAQALRENPKNEKAWVGLALVNFERKNFELALAQALKALDLCSHSRVAAHLLVQLSGKMEDLNIGLESLQNYIGKVGSDHLVSRHLEQAQRQFRSEHFAQMEEIRQMLDEVAS